MTKLDIFDIYTLTWRGGGYNILEYECKYCNILRIPIFKGILIIKVVQLYIFSPNKKNNIETFANSNFL